MIRNIFFAALLLPLPALADDCHGHIATMFDEGPLDPFARPPHSYVNTTYAADGSVKSTYLARFETPVESIGGTEGGTMFAMIVGSESWIGPSMDGPWTAAPNMVPDDHEAFVRLQMEHNVANLAQVSCPGLVEVEGQEFENVAYFTKTDPSKAAHGAWFGGLNSVFIDPETGRVMRWEITEAVSSFAPKPSGDRQVLIYTYEPDLRVDPPQ